MPRIGYIAAAHVSFLSSRPPADLDTVSPPVSLLLTLPRLAAVGPSSLHLLVPAHAGTQRDVNPRRCVEAKALGHLLEIQLGDVEDGPQAVAGVRVDVGLEAVLGRLVEVVVLRDQLLELALDVDDLLGGELKLGHGHLARGVSIAA